MLYAMPSPRNKTDAPDARAKLLAAALKVLAWLKGRKIAVLGDMLELGMYEQRGHEMVGIRAAEVADLLITVGERARTIAQATASGRAPR